MRQTVTVNQYEALFKKYYIDLCMYATSIVKDETEAEEIVQDLFVKLWQKRNRLFFEKNPKHYLLRAVKNNCLLSLRKQLKQVKLEVSEIDKTFAVDADAESQMSAKEISEVYNQTVERLTPRRKEIFQLIRNEGLKYREVAEKLNISVKTVEKSMGKTLQLFRRNFTEFTG